ncbi:MAG TPA: tetratricopeptide repeat protein [Bacteroidota bacterium]|jgi:putative thioredoxin|nr:tetratricopeptide repeat protein [Bacteroidota bacterium]
MSYAVTNFEIEVSQRSFQIPVLVDFWAEWCGPCRTLGPILDRLEQAQQRWVLAKVNTEELPDVAATYEIRSIPHVKLFSEGKPIAEFIGALPEYAVVQWLKKNIPGKNRKVVARAIALLEERRTDEATAMLKGVLADEPDNSEVRVLLAKLSVFSDPSAALQLIGGVDDVNDVKDAGLVDGLRVFLRLFDLANRPELLPEDDVKLQYLSASQDLRSQRFDKALEKLIEIIRNNRYYDDDGARKACIAIFKFLGEEHPVTIDYRRDFSRALY